MAKIKLDEDKINSALDSISSAKTKISTVESEMVSGLGLVTGARGSEYLNVAGMQAGLTAQSDSEIEIDDTVEAITSMVEEIKQWNEDVSHMGILERLFSTNAMTGLKLAEGFLGAGEQLVDGFASLLGKIAGKGEFQDKIAKFVAKDHIGDAFHNFYYNTEAGKRITQASLIRENGKLANVCKIVGTAVGYTAALSVAGLGTSMVASATAAGIGAMGGTMQAGLGAGMDYDTAFKKGVKNAAISAALVVGISYVARAASPYVKKGFNSVKNAVKNKLGLGEKALTVVEESADDWATKGRGFGPEDTAGFEGGPNPKNPSGGSGGGSYGGPSSYRRPSGEYVELSGATEKQIAQEMDDVLAKVRSGEITAEQGSKCINEIKAALEHTENNFIDGSLKGQYRSILKEIHPDKVTTPTSTKGATEMVDDSLSAVEQAAQKGSAVEKAANELDETLGNLNKKAATPDPQKTIIQEMKGNGGAGTPLETPTQTVNKTVTPDIEPTSLETPTQTIKAQAGATGESGAGDLNTAFRKVVGKDTDTVLENLSNVKNTPFDDMMYSSGKGSSIPKENVIDVEYSDVLNDGTLIHHNAAGEVTGVTPGKGQLSLPEHAAGYSDEALAAAAAPNPAKNSLIQLEENVSKNVTETGLGTGESSVSESLVSASDDLEKLANPKAKTASPGETKTIKFDESDTIDSLAEKLDKEVADGNLTRKQADEMFVEAGEKLKLQEKGRITELQNENIGYEQAKQANIDRKGLLQEVDGAKAENLKGYDNAVEQINDKIAQNNSEIEQLQRSVGEAPKTYEAEIPKVENAGSRPGTTDLATIEKPQLPAETSASKGSLGMSDAEIEASQKLLNEQAVYKSNDPIAIQKGKEVGEFGGKSSSPLNSKADNAQFQSVSESQKTMEELRDALSKEGKALERVDLNEVSKLQNEYLQLSRDPVANAERIAEIKGELDSIYTVVDGQVVKSYDPVFGKVETIADGKGQFVNSLERSGNSSYGAYKQTVDPVKMQELIDQGLSPGEAFAKAGDSQKLINMQTAGEVLDHTEVYRAVDSKVPAIYEPGGALTVKPEVSVPVVKQPGGAISVQAEPAVPAVKQPGGAISVQADPAVPAVKQPGGAISVQADPAVPAVKQPGGAISVQPEGPNGLVPYGGEPITPVVPPVGSQFVAKLPPVTDPGPVEKVIPTTVKRNDYDLAEVVVPSTTGENPDSVTPSGDTPSGGTPSGGTPSGDTPSGESSGGGGTPTPATPTPPTTSAPTTSAPTTASPTTASPTTASPTTASPTTAAPTTGGGGSSVIPEYESIPDTMTGKKSASDYILPAAIGGVVGAAGLAAAHALRDNDKEYLEEDDDDDDDYDNEYFEGIKEEG